jgi:hypothetical protein
LLRLLDTVNKLQVAWSWEQTPYTFISCILQGACGYNIHTTTSLFNTQLPM